MWLWLGIHKRTLTYLYGLHAGSTSHSFYTLVPQEEAEAGREREWFAQGYMESLQKSKLLLNTKFGILMDCISHSTVLYQSCIHLWPKAQQLFDAAQQLSTRTWKRWCAWNRIFLYSALKKKNLTYWSIRLYWEHGIVSSVLCIKNSSKWGVFFCTTKWQIRFWPHLPWCKGAETPTKPHELFPNLHQPAGD